VAETRVADEIDELYGLPLDEFTPARDALARGLRADGRRDEATEVAGLRKPVLAAWVVNRLVRTRRAEVRDLLRAADAVRAGRDGAGERLREALDALTSSARELLQDEGREPTDAVLRDVATTLRTGAAADPDALRAGRLTRPLEASGFEGMAGAVLRPRSKHGEAGTTAPRADRARAEADRARVEAAEQALTAARDEAKRQRRAADLAAREARRLAADADRAERAAAEAEKRLQRARRR
jgi:hypothetical protein